LAQRVAFVRGFAVGFITEDIMVSYDNYGRKVGEITTFITEDGSRVVSNTTYYNGQVVTQTISSRDSQGKVQQQTIYGGKKLP
jgi:hypothetical protein